MTEQAKALQRAYQKSWREKNKSKKAEYNKKYWERQAAKKQTEQAGGEYS
jgi:hypothetical protein